MTSLRPPRPSYQLTLAGFLLGSLLYLVVRTVGYALLPACEGHTVLALLPPLILGPGGIALAAQQISRQRRPALGLGLAISSLFPALGLGVRDISELRTVGCAGGYVVFGTPSGGRLPEVTLRPGQTIEVTVRPGGFQAELGPVKLSAQLLPSVLSAVIAPQEVVANTTAIMRLSAAANTPTQQYTVDVLAQQGKRGADGQLTVTVHP
ncbi:hypothetical protein EHF33_05595 [Deinococcus psychrotolerans]|uniref:Uncharacterized protein n=1 Tax=Deinococcus psychrotolerans TaxID=2489213 RepID=A0A3G8YA70_9DEIO|nr:hypothetical protein [Deinococcus psychrotolerans]AZI42289.1 hypothetical protein EHF33_05595 [Deinococcus psychrotolerans]